MITLNLKRRVTNDTIGVNAETLRKILNLSEAVAGRQLYKLFETIDNTISDRFWLSMIINWSPQEGLPLTTMAPWLKLAERVAELETEYEGPFVLSPGQADLIYKRLGDSEFKINGLNPALAAFILMFYDAMDKHPEEMTEDVMFDGHSNA